MVEEAPLRVAPGQTRSLNFKLWRKSNSSTLRCLVKYGMDTTSMICLSELVSYRLAHLTVHSPHKMTFTRQKNAVSYAILRPPSERASKTRRDELWPIMINLHGAGVEADSEQIRTMFDSVPDLRCWLLSPSGMTPWSGDDWRKSSKSPVNWHTTKLTAT